MYTNVLKIRTDMVNTPYTLNLAKKKNLNGLHLTKPDVFCGKQNAHKLIVCLIKTVIVCTYLLSGDNYKSCLASFIHARFCSWNQHVLNNVDKVPLLKETKTCSGSGAVRARTCYPFITCLKQSLTN